MNIGDYARTKSGIIGKLIIKEDTIAVAKWQGGYELQDVTTYIINDEKVYKNEIIKSSPNIIELLEVGDLVKIEYYSLRYEKRVERLFETTYKNKEYLNLENSKCDFMLINKEFTKHDKVLEPVIKSIVTKEQIEQMEYKL